ncbi:MAG: hypothetical protein MJE66_00640, partial [Proteobacteria bacterium]|nr:hypothetical protein [Pseudomonadota bacterium]
MADKKPAPLLGRLAVQLKMITPEQLAEAVDETPGANSTQLGQALVERGAISPGQLAKLEKVQKDVIAKHRAKQGGGAPAAAKPAPAA